MIDKMREEFEAWAKGDADLDISKMSDGGYYRNIQTIIAWDAWQSSRAALRVELPKYYSTDSIGLAYCADAVVDSLDAAGVRYK